MKKIPKRFIAGAVCPRCAEQDKIRAWDQNGVRYRECVNCDFFEQLALEEDSTQELPTRVNQPREEDKKQQDDIRPVRILDPRKLH